MHLKYMSIVKSFWEYLIWMKMINKKRVQFTE